MTAVKQRFVRENCDCRHPACTAITSSVHLYLHDDIQFLLMLFSQNPIKKKGNKPLDSRQLSTQINNKRYWAAFATKLQEHEWPKQQLMKEGSSWCVCTLYKRHRNTSVAVSQKSKKHQKAYWEDKAAFPFTTVDNGIPSPYLLLNGSINLQKQNYELECSNAC